ncbi:LLM class flavin-dependent oxidoreductase [Sphingobium sp. 10 DY56-G10]|uniref:LLM class flavin-dependent oxidoreductase n=1 Tax=Sphingomonadales TaxID=204457 RepID=UPI0000D7B1F0|nr:MULTISPECIES: LLM class flavin-dependent oxidoreductase [Sphingomonadaceae]EAT06815.1 luciferase-like protein [Sphingomonas sp. SKA58]|tara:strand:- start:6016 stop:7122 length:1107 start_codon:yes stop_codon:yes gene_type:complete
MAMQCGIFMTPYNPPSRTARQVFDWALDIARIADEAGYADFMIGEHYTLGWENIPMPEAIIAACAQTTKQIRFAPMAHLLPYHDPATLAIRIGWLSQVMEGRYFLGVAPGGHHTDAILHGFESISELPPMQLEALHLIERVWEGKPFLEKGKYFKAGFPGADTMPEYNVIIADNSPYGGRDKMEIAVTGLSQNSSSMRFAGERDYSPISFFGGTPQMKAHWDTWATAMESKGRTPDRKRYRVCRDIFIADTDAEAKRRFLASGLAQTWKHYLKEIYVKFGLFNGIIQDSGKDLTPDDIDEDFLAEHVVLCGSPETAIEKLEALADKVGGWGQLVYNQHDSIDDPKPWEESLRRFASEVAPKVRMPGID